MKERTVDIKNAPIIFPKYTAMLMERGVNIEIVGRRETDTKLASMIYSAVLTDSVEQLPDMMQYNINSKTWESISVEANEKVVLKNESSILVEYMNIVREWSDIILNVIKNFVIQFSAAKIQI